ncbi:MAG TPA: Gfo/Idh/MocA family oxidoreductase, partial [Candidatus Paceibacterota bacterium]|nr:Gfo/Idh/MocA family oxidoreductase [Candidatus Paceibacterota bacterium]
MNRIAILGTGAIADSHLSAYRKLSDQCRIVALVDLFPEKARAKAAQHQLDVPVYEHLEALCRGVDFDAASVCLPPFEHAAAAVALLQAGKHVLVEKPMATCLDECDRMLAAARKNDRVLSVVAQNRYQAAVQKLKRVVESGLIGKILCARVDSFWWRGGNYYDLWWRGTWAKEGGGCTMNHAVHHIDLLQWMMGMPTEVQAYAGNLAHENSEVEDFATATLQYANGSVGQINASLIHHGEEQQFVLQGERAQVALPWKIRAMRQTENGFPADNPELAAEIQTYYDQLPAAERSGHEAQIANFLAAVDRREPLLLDGEQGRRAIELISAVYQSSHERRPVQLPLSSAASFYTREGILAHARRFHEKTRNV